MEDKIPSEQKGVVSMDDRDPIYRKKLEYSYLKCLI